MLGQLRAGVRRQSAGCVLAISAPRSVAACQVPAGAVLAVCTVANHCRVAGLRRSGGAFQCPPAARHGLWQLCVSGLWHWIATGVTASCLVGWGNVPVSAFNGAQACRRGARSAGEAKGLVLWAAERGASAAANFVPKVAMPLSVCSLISNIGSGKLCALNIRRFGGARHEPQQGPLVEREWMWMKAVPFCPRMRRR